MMSLKCTHFMQSNTVIFLPIKPTPVSGIVPNAKKYVFFPIEGGKIPKMRDIFPFRLLFILVFCKPSLSLSFLVNFNGNLLKTKLRNQ